MLKGQKMSEESKAKISAKRKLQGNFRTGTHFSEEHKSSLGKSLKLRNKLFGRKGGIKKGSKFSEVAKQNMKEGQLLSYKNGTRKAPWTGKKRPDISERARDRMLGKELSSNTKQKLSEAHSKEKHWNWQGGVTKENKRIRNSAKWKEWRKKVFERDNHTCQECGKVGGYLEPHHIFPIRSDKENLFNTNNGITLCRPCHQKTIWKESNYQEKYYKIVAARM